MPDRMVIAYEDATGVLKPLTVGNVDGAALPVSLAALLSREDPDLGLATYEAGTEYDYIAAGATRTLMGTSQLGDLLGRLVIVVTTPASSQVQIKDGGDAAITIFPNGMPVGVYPFPIGAISRTGGWQVIVGAGSAVWATGVFA